MYKNKKQGDKRNMAKTKQEKIDRQDFVDNKILDLVLDLSPDRSKIHWDIECITDIRNETYRYIQRYIKDFKEEDFYPYIDDEDTEADVKYVGDIPVLINILKDKDSILVVISITCYININQNEFYFIGESKVSGKALNYITGHYIDGLLNNSEVFELSDMAGAVNHYSKLVKDYI
jgi:hypothetical protein